MERHEVRAARSAPYCSEILWDAKSPLHSLPGVSSAPANDGMVSTAEAHSYPSDRPHMSYFEVTVAWTLQWLHVAACNWGSCLPLPLHTVAKFSNLGPEPQEDPPHPEPLSTTERDSATPHFGHASVYVNLSITPMECSYVPFSH